MSSLADLMCTEKNVSQGVANLLASLLGGTSNLNPYNEWSSDIETTTVLPNVHDISTSNDMEHCGNERKSLNLPEVSHPLQLLLQDSNCIPTRFWKEAAPHFEMSTETSIVNSLSSRSSYESLKQSVSAEVNSGNQLSSETGCLSNVSDLNKSLTDQTTNQDSGVSTAMISVSHMSEKLSPFPLPPPFENDLIERCNFSESTLRYGSPLHSSVVLNTGPAVTESEFLMRKLGGFRNIGWTLDRRINEKGQVEHQALVYSLHTFNSYLSQWMTDEQSALKAALAKCYGRERKEHDIRDDDQEGFFTPDSYREDIVSQLAPITTDPSNKLREPTLKQGASIALSGSCHQPKEEIIDHGFKRRPCMSSWQRLDRGIGNLSHTTSSKESNTRVLVWASYIPQSIPVETIASVWRLFLPSTTRLLGIIKIPIASQGLLVFDNLPSAIEFIRAAKSKQLELFDLFVARERLPSLSYPNNDILFHESKAIGFALVNVSPQHPTCIHTLLRLSQKDAVALGHKRTSTETLRLLLTHPEVSPVMVVPPQSCGSFSADHTTPLSQTPSHRRASIWCALCFARSNDIPGAWKHVSRSPHETLREARNASLLNWLSEEHSAFASTLMRDNRPEISLESIEAKIKRSPREAKSVIKGLEASVFEQFSLLGARKLPKQLLTRSTAICTPCNPERKQMSNTSPSYQQVKGVKELNPEAPSFVPSSINLSSQEQRLLVQKVQDEQCSGSCPKPTSCNKIDNTSSQLLKSSEGLDNGFPSDVINTNTPFISFHGTEVLHDWSTRQGSTPGQQSQEVRSQLRSNVERSLKLQHGAKLSILGDDQRYTQTESSPILTPQAKKVPRQTRRHINTTVTPQSNSKPSKCVEHEQKLLNRWSNRCPVPLSNDSEAEDPEFPLFSSVSSSRGASIESIV